MEVGFKMASSLSEWHDKAPKMNFEETELRLGLSDGGGGGSQRESVTNNNNNRNNNNGKRGYSQTLDLKLNISTKEATGTDPNETAETLRKENSLLARSNYAANPPARAQIVGWPPVQSFRKNIVAIRKSYSTTCKNVEESSNDKVHNGASLVKVSMDGAPYLRKVDLKIYISYQELFDALGKMFSSFTIDKDGDWMLVGDVPWEMFVKSCKRLRIVKGTEAIGLAPRAMEKMQDRN